MAKSCSRKVKVKIGRRTFMARPKGCGPSRKRKKGVTPAALKPWVKAAKACRGEGKIGSGKRTSCIKTYVREH